MFDLRYLLEFPYTAFGEWQVVDPHANYLGLPYGEWVRNWVNWLIRPDPDQHNNGPVVYLRGLDFKESTAYGSFIRLENERDLYVSKSSTSLSSYGLLDRCKTSPSLLKTMIKGYQKHMNLS